MKIEPASLSTSSPKHGRLALFWTILGALTIVAVFPYVLALNPGLLNQVSLPVPVVILISLLQSTALIGLGSWAGLRLGQDIQLDSPLVRAWVYGTDAPGISLKNVLITAFTGFAVGLLILLLDHWFQPLMPPLLQYTEISVGLWKRLLACFYGGITEELLLRLFLMTLIVWLIWKFLLKKRKQPATAVFWTAIIIAALLFGLGHLPTVAAIWPLTTLVVTRTVLLNAIGGIAFGFFYWRWGLEYAMLAHFMADIAVHGLGGI